MGCLTGSPFVYTLEELVNKIDAGEDLWAVSEEDAEKTGLAKALSNFYFNDKSDAKYTLSTMKVFESLGLTTKQFLKPHSSDPNFMEGYYSELAEEYHANRYGGVDGVLRVEMFSGFTPSAADWDQAFEPIDRQNGERYSFLKDEWFAASLQAIALADARPDMKPVQRNVFISSTTKAIVNGEVESELTDEMREKVELFSQLKQQEKAASAALRQAWADSGITAQVIEPGMLTDEINSASAQLSNITGQLFKLTNAINMPIDIREILAKYDAAGSEESQPSALSAYA